MLAEVFATLVSIPKWYDLKLHGWRVQRLHRARFNSKMVRFKVVGVGR